MNVLLDEAAAHATADQRIDLDLVLRRVAQDEQSRHRTRTWQWGGLAALAVAAVALLVAVLVPPSGVLRGDPGPAGRVPGVTGLPASWYYAPPWTPPVTRRPMSAAVMVLQAPLQASGSRQRIAGPVLVSADARTYASLPNWSLADGGVTLSRDGRQVAWWTVPESAASKVVVHRLVLATGQQQDMAVEAGDPESMTFAGDDLYITGTPRTLPWPKGTVVPTFDPTAPPYRPIQPPRTAWRGVYRISATGAVSTACRCTPYQLGATHDGQLIQSQGAPSERIPGVLALWGTSRETGSLEGEGDSGVSGRVLFASPDDQRSAALITAKRGVLTIRLRADPELGLATTIAAQTPPGASFPVTSAQPITYARLLGWTDAGVLLRIETSDGPRTNLTIQSMDPRTGAMTVISRPKNTGLTLPLVVAPGLIGPGPAIPAPAPSFASTDRSHVAFLASTAWSRYGGLALGVLGAAALLGAGLAIRSRRRPR